MNGLSGVLGLNSPKLQGGPDNSLSGRAKRAGGYQRYPKNLL
jgi:hypothetical protein